MMQESKGPSGFFADLPYFGPVESSTFFELVASHGLHKLSEKLMVGSRTRDYFVKPDGGKISAALTKNDRGAAQAKNRKPNAFRFPTLKQRLDSGPRVPKTMRCCEFAVVETASRSFSTVTATTSTGGEEVAELTLKGIDRIWTALISHGFELDVAHRCTIPNVDLCVNETSGSGELLLSLLLLGIKSIADFFEGNAQPEQSRREAFRIFLTVLGDEFGKCSGDAIQVFIEGTFQMPVERQSCSAIDDTVSSAQISMTQSSEAEEWMENVRGCASDAHEELCDQMGDVEGDEPHLISPVILIVVPWREELRRSLKKVLLDSYSSEPIRVVEEVEWEPGAFSHKSPIILMCSTSFINRESCVGGFDQLLSRLSVRCVIHGGFCEFGATLNEELTNTISLLDRQMCEGCPVFVHQHARLPFVRDSNGAHDKRSTSEAANVVLLLFRRFLTQFSPESCQPYFSLSRSLFLSRKSWQLLSHVIGELSLSGAVKTTDENVDSLTVELTVLGRFLSFRFRLSDARRLTTRLAPEFSPQDVKTILWGHLFRQSKDVIEEIIAGNYFFREWVKPKLEDFCVEHNLVLQSVSDTKRVELIRQLSCFGLSGGKEEVDNRAHFLLSVPFGRRLPLQSHASGIPVTTSRGWYDHAPLRMGLSLEKRQVPVFCLPGSGLYCEVVGPRTEEDFHIQCPTEISYPLIVAHSALHISLHNNCVFLESTTENSAVPLPLTLLQSHTMNAILESSGLGEVGFWLDGVLSDKTLAPSDASMLRPLLQHKPSLIGLCERNPFRRKRKRVKETGKNAEKEEEFAGMKPRTLTEEDTVEDFTKLVAAVGRAKAEASLRGKKGFGFLEPSHELHPYYLHVLKKKGKL